MKKEPKVYLEHILQCTDIIETYLFMVSNEEFNDSLQIQDAIIRRIQIIGEAVKYLPESLKVRYPDVPWKRIASMRDILVHEYFGVDLKLTWKVAKIEIPILRLQIQEVKDKL